MLKGETYGSQLFESFAYRLTFDTMLGGECGIIDSFDNEMEVTSTGTDITISSGVAVIKGGILRETSNTTLTPELANDTYYSVVLEIDLSQVNTSEAFNQGAFKLISSVGSYPTLIQQDIAKITDGMYQMELARFQTTLSGITDLTDRRPILSYQALSQIIRDEIQRIIQEDLTATDIGYDNNASGLEATNVQDGIDELENKKFDKTGGIINGATTILGQSTGRKTDIYAGNIELFKDIPYIDFHYNNSSSDYSSRIIEEINGCLKIANQQGTSVNGLFIEKNLQVNGDLGIKYNNGNNWIKFMWEDKGSGLQLSVYVDNSYIGKVNIS